MQSLGIDLSPVGENRFHINMIIMPPLKKERHIALHMTDSWYVHRSVSLSHLVQQITHEHSDPETSNVVGSLLIPIDSQVSRAKVKVKPI